MRSNAKIICVLTTTFMLVGWRAGFSQTAYFGLHAGALAKASLDAARPKAPFDLTGTWDMLIEPAKGMHRFDPPPQLTPEAEQVYQNFQQQEEKGLPFHDDAAACWPLGMPRMMTRFWPVQIIQLPTMIEITAMFDNSVRWVYMDGRPHPPEDRLVESFNGHSIGHWEGQTLVIDTVGLANDHHWIQEGIPTGNKLHIVERIQMVDRNGKAFDDEFSMTDPDHWIGTWKHTKRFNRNDGEDIEEHRCIYEDVQNLPSFKHDTKE